MEKAAWEIAPTGTPTLFDHPLLDSMAAPHLPLIRTVATILLSCMKSKSSSPRMTAILKSSEERNIAYETLSRYNLTFSEFTRYFLCEGKLPPHTLDFPVYQVAVQFLWVQQQVLNNLHYFKVQARLGRIPEPDMPKLEAVIEEANRASRAIIAGIFSINSPQNVEKLLEESRLNSNGIQKAQIPKEK